MAIWSAAEPCLGIVAACLPTLRPLFKGFFSLPMSNKERSAIKYGSEESGSTGKSNILNFRSGDNRPFKNLGDSVDDTTGVAYSASATATGEYMVDSARTDNIPMNTIAVNTSWEHQRGII